MSRFNCDLEEGIPWGMWETIVSRALASARGQRALAELEEALLALPEPKLVEGHLAHGGAVCAVGAYVAHKRALVQGTTIEDAIRQLDTGEEYEDVSETAYAGKLAGLRHAVAWHLAYLNDEQFFGLTPEHRYEKVLTWVRRAQGKGSVVEVP